MNKKIYYGKVKASRNQILGKPANYFVICGNTASSYTKMFEGYLFGQKVKVTIELVDDKEWKREVFGDPR